MGIITKVLRKRKIKEIQLRKEKEKYFKWEEMDEVVDKVVEELFLGKEGQLVGVLYDVDVDGLFAGYTIEDYLRRKNINVNRYMNKGKKHGLQEESLQEYIDDGLDWLFIVDAGSGNVTEIKKLTASGIKVIVLDHHPYEVEDGLDKDMSWILNVVDQPQLPALSGCGVVYRFVEKIANIFGDMVGQYEKFVGITVLSDACDMSVSENRYYVQRAYEEYRGNHFLQQFPFYGSWKSFYSYGVIPYLNAAIRIGEEKQIMDLINNMNMRTKTNKIPRDMKRVKTRQEKLIEEIYGASTEIKREGITYLLRRTREELRPVGGLAANQLVNKYEQPALVLYRNGDVWEGSFRSNSYTKDVLEEHGFKAKGHKHACGVWIENKTLQSFIKEFKKEITEGVRKPEFKARIGNVSDKTWLDIARFNEFSGTNMEGILVRLQEGVSESDYIEEVSDKKKHLMFAEGMVIDFTEKESDVIVVEPVLKDVNYQLIRI